MGYLGDAPEENGTDWQRVRRRKIQAEQLAKLERHAREIFETLGMDLSSLASQPHHRIPHRVQGRTRLSRQCLFEDPGLPAYRIPQALIELYGGSIGFPELCLYANFVASIEGIVALEQQERSGTVISGGSQADRFVMGLLRACAEAVVVAGGTFRATPNHRVDGRPHLPRAGRRIRAHA